ncbi:MAG: putative porin [Muribaculaceae bacterium]|nr:putative porin [Muribaculaceae bacterium]
MNKGSLILLFSLCCVASAAAQSTHSGAKSAQKPIEFPPPVAWKLIPPLGLREEAVVDTMYENYAQRFVPSDISDAYATTGNYGAEGLNMIHYKRPEPSDFFFRDALYPWLPSEMTARFYNSRRPMTLLSYNTAGGRDNAQERLNAIFSGNINKKAQVGALLDYIYSKGCYNNQADKNLIWGASGSYIGDRYEFQGYFTHYNSLNKENGGITDIRYITDPAEVQGGVTKVNPKSIPTNLNAAHTRVTGTQFYMNHRYKIGYWHTDSVGAPKGRPELDENGFEIPRDSVIYRTYIPVTSVIWTMEYNRGRHNFRDDNVTEASKFFEHTYLNPEGTNDKTRYWSVRNTVGISLLEGFNRYAKFGLAGYVTHEIRRYTQTADTLDRFSPDWELDPFPVADNSISHKTTQNLLRVGGQLTKQHGSLLHYAATAQFGILGEAAGEVNLNGNVDVQVPMRRENDSLYVQVHGGFDNTRVPYLLRKYISNHFIWDNDFNMTRRYHVGGSVAYPRSGTVLNARVENIQNLTYFNSSFLPAQYNGNVQVLTLSAFQNLKAGILHWDNRVTYQASTNQDILPLPALAIYSNLYLKFRVATLFVQFGIDCDYYTKYYAPKYQPATASFATQHDVKLGNYPFMNVYANMKLSKARFYVMLSHVNQGLTGNNYFSVVDYPLNPRRLQIGVSVDFAN